MAFSWRGGDTPPTGAAARWEQARHAGAGQALPEAREGLGVGLRVVTAPGAVEMLPDPNAEEAVPAEHQGGEESLSRFRPRRGCRHRGPSTPLRRRPSPWTPGRWLSDSPDSGRWVLWACCPARRVSCGGRRIWHSKHFSGITESPCKPVPRDTGGPAGPPPPPLLLLCPRREPGFPRPLFTQLRVLGCEPLAQLRAHPTARVCLWASLCFCRSFKQGVIESRYVQGHL